MLSKLSAVPRSLLGGGGVKAVVLLALLGTMAVTSPGAGAQSDLAAPGPVASVTLSRADGSVTATWPAADHATSYHVTYTTDGAQSWQLAALNHPATQGENSITIDDADNDATYIVGVRARNSAGGSSWVNSAAAGPYTPPPPTPAPGAVASVTLARGDGTVTATWPAAAHATSYHVTYTTDGAQSWQLAALDHLATTGENSITIDDADNDATYIVGVRARNSAGGSSWVNSAAAGPYTPPPPTPAPGAVASVTLARGDGTVTATWPAAAHATSYHVTYTTDGAQSWQLAALDHPAVEGVNSITIDGADNDATYIVGVRARNATGGSSWVNSPAAGPWSPPPTLEAGEATDTTITMTLDNYSGQWYYRAEETSGGGSAEGAGTWGATAEVAGASGASGQSGCNGPVNGGSTTVGGLDPDTKYTLGAYGNAQCGGAQIASGAQAATLPTPPGQVAKPTVAPQDRAIVVSWSPPSGTATSYQVQYRPCQVTGPAGSQCRWRTCQQLDARKQGCVVFGPWQPGWAPWGNGTWLHGNSGSVTTTMTSATVTGLNNGVRYQVRVRGSNATSNGTSHGPWSTPSDDMWPNPQPALGVSNVTETTATLTLPTAEHSGQWYYQANTGPDSTCRGPVASGTTTQSLTGLTAGMSYAYNAYQSKTSNVCTSMIGAYPAVFTTLGLNTTGVTDTAATLIIMGHNGAWYYKADTGPDSGANVCRGPVNTRIDSLTGLTAGTAYTYTAYSDSGCTTANRLATADAFTTLQLTASSITATTATLTLAGHTGSWYVKKTAPSTPVGTCSSEISTTTHNLDSLSAGTAYTYKAYSDSACTTAIATASFTTPVTLTASNIATTTATLTLAGHTAAWRYKADAGPHTTCSAEIAAGTSTADLTGLTAGTWYTYRAYSDSSCSTEIAAEAFSTAVTVSSVDTSDNSVADIGLSNNAIWMVGQAFTTGSNSGGYTLSSVTAVFSTTSNGDQGNVVVELHAASGSNPGTLLATLSGTDHIPTAADDYTFDCSTGCALEANTSYFVTIEAPSASSGRYLLETASQNSEAKVPTSNGWAIADDARVGIKASNYWDANSGKTAQLILAAVPKPSLSASSVAQTTATLTITGQTGSWWLKETVPSTGSCTAGESDYSHALTSLTADTDYTYKAYSDSNCATELLSVTFTTVSLTASAITGTTATLTIAGSHPDTWYVKKTAPSTGSCSSAITTTTHSLSSLTAGTSYTYKAYSDSTCTTANELASETFTTLSPPDSPGSVGAQYRDTSNTTTVNNRLQVWWDRPTGATGAISYTVDCSDNNGTSWSSPCATISATTNADLIATITNTGVNKVRVRSTQNSLNSAWVESAVPSGTAPGAPTNVSSTLVSGGYRMQWSKPSSPTGAVGYQTQCRDSNTNWTNCGSNGSNGVISPTTSSTVTTNVGYIFQFRVRSLVNGLVSAWLVSS